MMKRMRTVDVPKFRRPLKNRTTSRLGESVYFRFFNSGNLIYFKFLAMWMACITLDFIIGFRFELLWPLWLLVRHLYESFRVHAFSSSLHYSAFSVFFVCVTATSDLVCYLFIPIQVLLFIASTYVWVQFVYQSSDRGICLPSLFLWTLFLFFEYSIRYRFDNATWYLTRGSWITAGLFPSTADSVAVGAGSGSSPPPSLSPRLELYRPFAAHCLGFPVVTLGFRVKSFFSKWRMRVRKEQVMRQNEFFERILASAVPCNFEERRHFISSRHYLDLEQDAIETSRLYSQMLSSNGSNAMDHSLALYNPVNAVPVHQHPSISRKTTQKSLSKSAIAASAGGTNKGHPQQPCNGHIPAYANNGVYISSGGLHKRNVTTSANKSSGWAKNEPTNGSAILSRKTKTAYSYRSKYGKLWSMFGLRTVRALFTILQSICSNLYRACIWPLQNNINNFLCGLRGSDTHQLQDDLISSSGDGSHIAEDESDREDQIGYAYVCSGNSTPNSGISSKKKNRRTRGRTPLCGSGFLSDILNAQANVPPNLDSNYTNTTQNGHANSNTQLDEKLHFEAFNGVNSDKYPPGAVYNGKSNEISANGSVKEPINGRTAEIKQANIKDKELEKLRAEVKNVRGGELELKSQLNQTQQQERLTRNELAQSKSKFDQLETKYKQLTKQNEHYRANIIALEKRVAEMQVKKVELEKDLANERQQNSVAKQQKEEAPLRQNSSSSDSHLKGKISEMDREIRALKREIKSKDELNCKMDEELRFLRVSVNKQSDQESFTKQIELLQQKNFILEQTLSSENRLKQDLFRALNDSKAQIEQLNVRLRSYEQGNGCQENHVNNIKPESQSVSLSSITSGYSYGAQKSVTPPVSTSSLDIDAIINATGANNMSYSLSPLEDNHQPVETFFDAPQSDILTIGGHRMNNNSFSSSLVHHSTSKSATASRSS
ncbi:macoilin family domain-containing protein [Ditylenchus destructor]|uniref:Macoilin family domain-containing protein n=1 Tax=Ditylenchus destructor TaxID=166010 RepID=A0AAD4N2N6_9BILA|nr:macoilin family domain-containing protein [Ditylenchus destructor]